MLETLSLDAGGVLVRPNWHKIAAVFRTHGLDVPERTLPRYELMAMRDIDSAAVIRGTDDNDRVSRFFWTVLDYAQAGNAPGQRHAAIEEVKTLHAHDNLWEFVPPDVVPALERFAALGLRMIVLSNANGTVRSKLERLGLTRWFEHVVDSGEEEVEKPDPRFFELSLQRAQARPSTTLHVGDLFHVDVVGARAAGIRAVLLDRGGLLEHHGCERFADLMELASAIETGTLS